MLSHLHRRALGTAAVLSCVATPWATASVAGKSPTSRKVTSRDAKQHAVFEQRFERPWRFIDLPLGALRLDASGVF